MIQLIDIKDATITRLESSRGIVISREVEEVSYLYVCLEIDGFCKCVTIEGEPFQRVLDVIKEELQNKNN